MAEEKEKNKKVKVSTAIKRNQQNVKKKLCNKMFKSRVHTAIRQFNDHVKEKNTQALAGDLNVVYSLMDKGVKRGIFKLNKAKRYKARFASIANKQVSA